MKHGFNLAELNLERWLPRPHDEDGNDDLLANIARPLVTPAQAGVDRRDESIFRRDDEGCGEEEGDHEHSGDS